MGLPAEFLPRYTVDDYRRWKGDWELIEGIPFAMSPSPLLGPQLVGALLVARLVEALKDCPDCAVVYETDYIVNETTVLKPDIAVVCDYDPKDFIKTAPLLVVEIVSKSTALRDEKVKFQIYEREGVPFYLLVYPDLRKFKFYTLEGEKYRKTAEGGGQVEVPLKGCRVELDLGEVFDKISQRS